MFNAPKEVEVDCEWIRLVASNPTVSLDPEVFVLPMAGGLLVRVIEPGTPVVFVPRATLADLQGAP